MEGTRIDVALNYLCLTRTRSEAKRGCEAGAILLDGRPAKPSDLVRPGATVTFLFRDRRLDVRIDQAPSRQASRKSAREMYQVLRDEPLSAGS